MIASVVSQYGLPFLSDLPGADLRDLHILNGHPDTRCSIILCRAGYKFRFRVKQTRSPNKYNCYQFPGGYKLMKFKEGDDIQGRTLFVMLLAVIILNNVEDKLEKKGSTLSALISKDAAVVFGKMRGAHDTDRMFEGVSERCVGIN